jgi:hypothetical protein
MLTCGESGLRDFVINSLCVILGLWMHVLFFVLDKQLQNLAIAPAHLK